MTRSRETRRSHVLPDGRVALDLTDSKVGLALSVAAAKRAVAKRTKAKQKGA